MLSCLLDLLLNGDADAVYRFGLVGVDDLDCRCLFSCDNSLDILNGAHDITVDAKAVGTLLQNVLARFKLNALCPAVRRGQGYVLSLKVLLILPKLKGDGRGYQLLGQSLKGFRDGESSGGDGVFIGEHCGVDIFIVKRDVRGQLLAARLLFKNAQRRGHVYAEAVFAAVIEPVPGLRRCLFTECTVQTVHLTDRAADSQHTGRGGLSRLHSHGEAVGDRLAIKIQLEHIGFARVIGKRECEIKIRIRKRCGFAEQLHFLLDRDINAHHRLNLVGLGDVKLCVLSGLDRRPDYRIIKVIIPADIGAVNIRVQLILARVERKALCPLFRCRDDDVLNVRAVLFKPPFDGFRYLILRQPIKGDVDGQRPLLKRRRRLRNVGCQRRDRQDAHHQQSGKQQRPKFLHVNFLLFNNFYILLLFVCSLCIYTISLNPCKSKGCNT